MYYEVLLLCQNVDMYTFLSHVYCIEMCNYDENRIQQLNTNL